MKFKRVLLLALLLIVTSVLGAFAADSDKVDSWALEKLNAAITNGLVPSDMRNGYQNEVLRSEYARLLVVLIEKRTGKDIQTVLKDVNMGNEANPFTDTADSNVISLGKLKILPVREAGKAHPNEPITRQEVAVAITSAARFLGQDVKPQTIALYTDRNSIADWAKPAADYVYFTGIMVGDGNAKFEPTKSYSKQLAYMSMEGLWQVVKPKQAVQQKAEEKTAATGNVPVTGVALSAQSKAMYANESYRLAATVLPAQATNKKLSWVSSNPNVVAVFNDGLVTALSPGSATITVYTVDGHKSASCLITVAATNPAGISLNKTSVSIQNGTSVSLTATVTPANSSNKSITWTSSNTNIASVSSDGVVYGNRPGYVTITAKTPNGLTATCNVTVYTTGGYYDPYYYDYYYYDRYYYDPYYYDPYYYTSSSGYYVSIDSDWSSLALNHSATMTASGSYMYDYYVEWYSSNESVVRVSNVDTYRSYSSCTVTGVGRGTARVYVRIYDSNNRTIGMTYKTVDVY